MTNYRRGADFERRVMRHLEKCGYIVVRSAGSHHIADLVALRRGTSPMLIQCKTNGNLGPDEWNALIDAAWEAGAVPVMAWREGRKLRFTKLVLKKLDRKRRVRSYPMTIKER